MQQFRQALTPEQIAQYLQVNRETIYRYIQTGRLPAVKLGRYYRVPQESLTRFLLANSTDSKLEEALSERFLSIAERNKDISEKELEQDVAEAIKTVRQR